MNFDSLSDKLFKSDNEITIIPVGIDGFTADVKISESLEFTSSVPDNYVEDGSVMNDHIINNPITISIEGQVSDIHEEVEFLPELVVKAIDKASDIANNLYPVKKTEQTLDKINKTLSPITNALNTLNSAYKAGKQLYNMITTQTRERTRQDDFFDFVNRVQDSKSLINIETHFKVYKNMRILSFSIMRDNTTNEALKYKITAKEVRFAKTIYVDKNKYFQNNPSSSMSSKTKGLTNKGVNEGSKVDNSKSESFLYKVFK